MAGRGNRRNVATMEPPLTWDEHPIGEAACVFEVKGRLVFPDSRVLGERLAHVVRGGTRQLVLDLSGLVEIDAGIVGLLLTAARQLGWRGGRLAVVTADPQTESTLAITGLDSILEVARTQPEALRGIGVAPAAVPALAPG